MSRMVVLRLVLAGLVAALQISLVFANCQHGGNIPDPRYVDCFQRTGSQDANLPHDGYTSTAADTASYTANGCVSCCLSLSTVTEYYAGISVTGANTFRCTCGTKSEINDNFERWTGCQPCPGNSTQSCGHGALISIYEAFALPQGQAGPSSSEFTSERSYSSPRATASGIMQYSTLSVLTGYTTSMTSKAKTTVAAPSMNGQTTVDIEYTTSMASKERTTKMAPNMEEQTGVDIGIIAGAAGGGGAVLVVAVIITIVCILRRRGNKSNDQRTSLALGELNSHDSPSQNSASNPSFQSTPANVEDLYAKPNKKKKTQRQPPTTGDPEDPSYQDVLPTGTQHQYAAVQDDSHPYNAVGDETNLYDSIQDDPQYATVQKNRKQGPNVETNPLHGKGSVDNTVYDPGPLSNDNERAPSVCEMMDNIIYE